MFCINCGAKIDDHAKFCPSCGHQMQNSTQIENNMQSSSLNSNDHINVNQAGSNDINNCYYRMLQISPLLFIVAAMIIPFVYFLFLKMIAVVYVIVCCMCDIKEIKQKTAKDVNFGGVSIFAIIIFDVLYAEKYLCNRKKVIPSTSRVPFYLSLIIGIILFFVFPKNNLFKSYEIGSNGLNGNQTNIFEDTPFSNIFNSGVNCSSNEVVDGITESMFKVKKLPKGMKLTLDGIVTVEDDRVIKTCEASINFNIPEDTKKIMADDFNNKIFWEKVEQVVTADYKKDNGKEISALQRYYLDNSMLTIGVMYGDAIKEIAYGKSDFKPQRVVYFISKFDNGSGYEISFRPEQIQESWRTLASIISLWGQANYDMNQNNLSQNLNRNNQNITKDNASASTEEPNSEVMKEGLYAVYNHGDFKNYEEGMFDCSFDYCKNIDKQKLNQEESNFIKYSDIRGSVKIEFNKKQKSYQATGGFNVENACTLSAGGDDLSAPVLCTSNTNNSITCDFYDVFNDQTLSLSFKTSDSNLKVSLDPRSSISNEVNTNRCMNLIQKTPIKFESDEEHDRILSLSTKLDFIKANADILTLWKSLSADIRKKILPEQRKWIKEKDAKCGKADMKGNAKEISAMQKCHTIMTQQRIERLHDSLNRM